MKEYAVVWTHTNNLGLVQLPKFCSVLKVKATDEDDAIEVAIIQVAELINSQFPTFSCKILRDNSNQMRIDITENNEHIGCVYNFKSIS